MKQVLDEKDIRQPGSGLDSVCDARADEPRRIQINDHEDKHVYGPDAEGAAAIEIAEVFLLAAGFEEDGRDEKAR